jgi:uncharacterized protein (UPF0210 family)
MIEAVTRGSTIDKLEAAACQFRGIGYDPVPGDTPEETISAIIADETAIGMVNSKTTSVRIIPVREGRRQQVDSEVAGAQPR